MNSKQARVVAIIIAVAVLLGSAIGIIVSLQGRDDIQGVNIILMIGDGMGTGQIAAARYSSNPFRELNVDKLPFGGMVTTHAANNLVTDSAAAATALATGHKTNNGMIGIDPQGEVLETIFESAESRGMSTGLVTTTRITHATPAAFATHVISRNMEDEIAAQLILSGSEVLMGGGSSFLLPSSNPDSARGDERDLLAEAAEQGYTYLVSREGLLSMGGSSRVLGLFTTSHMSYHELRNKTLEPSLAEMTQITLDILATNPRGFFLMVEGGRIDHASHVNDLNNTIGDMIGFDEAIGVARNFTLANERTLLVVTADHETGGLSVIPTVSGSSLNVFWSTRGHTGNTVPIFSEGLSASLFSGTLDNTNVGERLFEVVRLVEGGSAQGSGYVTHQTLMFVDGILVVWRRAW